MQLCRQKAKVQEVCGYYCRAGVPFFSYAGTDRPERYVFTAGLSLTALVGLIGVESINRMYMHLGALGACPAETNTLWCVACCCGCCVDCRRKRLHPARPLARPHIPYLLRALRPVGLLTMLAVGAVAWLNPTEHLWAHCVSAVVFFASLSTYHFLLTLLHTELLRQSPRVCEEVLGAGAGSFRYQVKVWWIVVLFALTFVHEFTRITRPSMWENYYGPLVQWISVMGTLTVANVHSLDLQAYYRWCRLHRDLGDALLADNIMSDNSDDAVCIVGDSIPTTLHEGDDVETLTAPHPANISESERSLEL